MQIIYDVFSGDIMYVDVCQYTTGLSTDLRGSLDRGQTNTFMRSGWTGQDEELLEACSAALTSCTQPRDALQPSSSVEVLTAMDL